MFTICKRPIQTQISVYLLKLERMKEEEGKFDVYVQKDSDESKNNSKAGSGIAFIKSTSRNFLH